MIHIVTYVCIYKHECGVVIWKITEFYMRSQNCQTFYANIYTKCKLKILRRMNTLNRDKLDTGREKNCCPNPTNTVPL